MNEKAKTNSVVTDKWDNDTQTLTITVLKVGDIVVPFDKIAESILDTATVYGMRQRLCDKAALAKVDGISATAEDKFAAIKRLADHYLSGSEEWNLTQGPSGPRVDEWILRAIAELKGETVAESRERAEKAAKAKSVHVADIVKVWGQIKSVSAKRAELIAKASGVPDEKVAEMERELFAAVDTNQGE